MAERPWVTPEELKEYTEFEEVKNRADSKLKIDISRAESWVIDYCNNRFDDPEKYPDIPENVKTAVLLIAEAYAHNAVEQTKVRLKSETFDDYSYTAESSIILPGIPAMCRKGFFLLAGQPFGPGIHVSATHTMLTSSFQRFSNEGCMVMIL